MEADMEKTKTFGGGLFFDEDFSEDYKNHKKLKNTPINKSSLKKRFETFGGRHGKI